MTAEAGLDDKQAARVFVIGAGMSKPVGAPLVSEFLSALLKAVAPSRTRLLRRYLAKRRSNPDLEVLIRELENPAMASEDTQVESVRRELLNAVVETLAIAHFKHLHNHFGLPRQDDPYFIDARDVRLVSRIRKKHKLTLGGSESTEAAMADVQLARLQQRRPRTVDEQFPELHERLFHVGRAVGAAASRKAWSQGLNRMDLGSDEHPDRRQLAESARILLGARGPVGDPHPLLAGVVRPGDTVITFNYDLFLDWALNDRVAVDPTINVNYGASFIGSRISHDRPFEDWSGFGGWHGQGGVYSEDAVYFLKLHGSIDWLRCPRCLKVLATPGSPATSTAVRTVLRADARFIAEHAYKYRKPCCEKFDPNRLTPYVIGPTPRKDIVASPLVDIWDCAKRRIGRASELVFVGFALRAVDSHVTELIEDACRGSSPRIVVVNRDTGRHIRRRYSSLADRLGTKAEIWLPADGKGSAGAWEWLEELTIRSL